MAVLGTTYWAATDQTVPKAWQVDLGIGWVGVVSEGISRNVWPVRDGL